MATKSEYFRPTEKKAQDNYAVGPNQDFKDGTQSELGEMNNRALNKFDFNKLIS